MRRNDAIAVLLMALSLTPGVASAQRHPRSHPSRTVPPEKLDERISQVRQLAARAPAMAEEVKPLLALAEEFRVEARQKVEAGQAYSAGRLAGASSSIAEAIEMMVGAHMKTPLRADPVRPRHREDSPEREAARELGMAYFRMAQLDFFSRQPGAGKIVDLARLSRRLYQEGRAAYDRDEVTAALQLAVASRELSSAFEKYIQAQLPEELPPPPKVDRE
jgi:hypothetical protein